MDLKDFTQKIWTQRLFTNLTEELNLIECRFETAKTGQIIEEHLKASL